MRTCTHLPCNVDTRVMLAFCAVCADLIVNAAVFCHVPVALAFVAAANRNTISDSACIPRYVNLPY